MRPTPLMAAVMALVTLAGGACSNADDADSPAGESAGAGSRAAPEEQAAEETDPGIVYTQHAVLGSSTADGDAHTITLRGVDQRVSWFTSDESGVLPTDQFALEDLPALLATDPLPQAAFVPNDTDAEPVLLEITGATWDGEQRAFVYDARTPDTPDPRLAELAGESGTRLPDQFAGISVHIAHPSRGRPSPLAPTATTTTSTTTTVADSATTGPTSTVAPTGPATAPPGTTPATTPATTPPSTPSGPAVITVTPTDIELSRSGGTQTMTIRNTGSGVGSWSANAPTSEGITVSPTSGILFPGSETTVSVRYDGSRFPADFLAQIYVFGSNGSTQVTVVIK